MSQLAEFQRLAQAKTYATFAYDSARDEVQLQKPRGRFLGYALGWLKHRLRGRNAAQEQVTEKFFTQVKSFYGEDVLQSVLAQKAGKPFTGERPPQLTARHVRRVLQQSNVTAEKWLRPVLEQTKAAPHDIGPLWNSLGQRHLLTTGYAQRLMQQERFPPGSDAEHLRSLMAAGFFRMFGEPPELRGGPGNYRLAHRSHYVGMMDVRPSEDVFNVRGGGDMLSVHQVTRFCKDGRLDAAAFWKGLNSRTVLKGHAYGAQTSTGPVGPHQLARDLQRSIATTQYNINGKTQFKDPPALLAEVWRAAEGNPDCFTGLCNLMTQTVGNQFHANLLNSRLTEYTDFYMRGGADETQMEIRTNGKARAQVNWQRSVTQESGQVTSLTPSAEGQQFFALGAGGKAERQQALRMQVSSTGYVEIERMAAQFGFDAPLAELSVAPPP